MKKSILLMAMVAMVTTGLFSQDTPVLLTIDNEQITLDEFERIYRKNNNEASLNRQTPEEYLELFINFKLKVPPPNLSMNWKGTGNSLPNLTSLMMKPRRR